MAAKKTSSKKSSAKKIERPEPPKSKKKTSAADAELAAARATIKKLKATVGVLEKNLAKAEKKADGFKSDLKKLRAGAVTKVKKAKSDGVAKVKKSKKPVDVIAEHAEPVEPAALPVAELEPEVVGEPEVVAVAEAPTPELTVVQLRSAAREQGIPGYSKMRKEQLIAALS